MEPSRGGEGAFNPSVGPGDSPSAYQHAPTLLTASERGAGSVQVWSPNIWVLRSGIVQGFGMVMSGLGIWGTFIAITILRPPTSHEPVNSWIPLLISGAAILLGAGGVAIGRKSLRHLKYVTTDGHGIALTTRKGSTALAWEDILEASLAPPLLILETRQGRVKAPLTGFLLTVQKELFATVAQRACLYKKGALRCVREDQLGKEPRSQPELSGVDIGNERAGLALFKMSLLFTLIPNGITLLLVPALVALAHYGHVTNFWPSRHRTHRMGSVLASIAADVGNSKTAPEGSSGHQAPQYEALVVLFVRQQPGDPMAAPSAPKAPGFTLEREFGRWAPAEYQRAGSFVYQYDLCLRRNDSSGRVPQEIQVQLDYGSRQRCITARLPSQPLWILSWLRRNRPHIDLYSNNWGDHPAPGIETGQYTGTLPSLRDWSYGGAAAFRTAGKPYAAAFSFEPTPAEERITISSTATSTAAAAWLPGVIKSTGAWCTIRFSDGTSKRARIDRPSGATPSNRPVDGPVGPDTIRTRWGLSPDEYRALPDGRI